MSTSFPLQAVVDVATKDAENSVQQFGDRFLSVLESIEQEVKNANNELQTISSNTNSLVDTSESSSQKQTNSWSRVGKAIAGVTVIAGGFMAKMIESSPALAGSLDEIGFQFERIANVLGDSLVPFVETLIPYFETLADIFVQLDPDIQTLIASTIALTFAGGALNTVLGTLGISLGAIAAPILIAVAAIALLALAWKNNFGGIQETTAEVFGNIKTMFNDFIGSNRETFQELIANVTQLWEIIKPVVEAIASLFWDVLGGQIESVVSFIIQLFDSLLDTVNGIVKVLIGIFTWDMEMITEGLGDIFKGYINLLIEFINSFVVDPVNGLIELINKIPGADISWRMEPLPKMHSGGVVGGSSGTDEVMRVLQKGEGVIDKDTMSRGIGKSITINFYNTQVRDRRDLENVRRSAEMGAVSGLRGQRYVKGGYNDTGG